MQDSRKPDLNAPRFKPSRFNTLGRVFIEGLLEKHPALRHLSVERIKAILYLSNELIFEKIIEHRDGVLLPENIGNMFIGACLPKIRKNVDFRTSVEHLKVIQHRNWESDAFIAKIFYTNYETKYKFKNHELWGFTACRKFTRAVGATFPLQWKKYVQIDHTLKISRLFRKNSYRMMMTTKDVVKLESYDEFDMKE